MQIIDFTTKRDYALEQRYEQEYGAREACFLLNHNSFPAVVPLDKPCRETLSGTQVRDTVQLAPCGVAVLEEQR